MNNPFTGVYTEANTLKTAGKFYYDGTSNLSALHISCNTLTLNPNACIHNANCGMIELI